MGGSRCGAVQSAVGWEGEIKEIMVSVGLRTDNNEY